MEMRNGVGSRTMSEDIFSSHYYGPASPELVVPNGYDKSSSAIFPSPSFVFNNNSSAQTWDKLMEHSVTLGDMGDYAVFATSGNKFVFSKEDWTKYGYAHSWDESMDRMDGWIGATVGDHAIECVTLPAKSQGLIEFPEEQAIYNESSAMTDVGYTQKTIPFGEMKGNDYGKSLSQLANTKNRIREFLFIDPLSERPWFDTEAGDYTNFKENALNWAKFLSSEGMNGTNEVKAIGVADLSYFNSEAATLFKSVLLEDQNIYNHAWEIAGGLGLQGKEAEEFVARYLDSVLEHELYHFRESYILSKKASERRAGKIQEKYHSREAELRSNTLQGKIHGILSRIYAAYAKAAPTGESGRSQISSKLEQLADGFEAEALSLGMETGEAIDYIERKLEEYAGKELTKSELESEVEGKNKAEDPKNDDNDSKKGVSSTEHAQKQEGEQEAADESAE